QVDTVVHIPGDDIDITIPIDIAGLDLRHMDHAVGAIVAAGPGGDQVGRPLRVHVAIAGILVLVDRAGSVAAIIAGAVVGVGHDQVDVAVAVHVSGGQVAAEAGIRRDSRAASADDRGIGPLVGQRVQAIHADIARGPGAIRSGGGAEEFAAA